VNFRYTPCEWGEISESVQNDIKSITVDSFWEDNVIESKHYKITANGDIAGYFAIHDIEMLTLFGLSPKYARYAQEAFAEAKRHENVTHALVPTGGELFMSCCFDSFTRIEKQAYFFAYNKTDYVPSGIELTVADVENDEDIEILKLGEDFFDKEIEKLRGGADYLKIYVARKGGEAVGFGIIEYGKVIEDIASIGMYVIERHRKQGFGTAILRELRQIAEIKGKRVFSGCWYYNHNSKKTIESAGGYSKTRLMRFYF